MTGPRRLWSGDWMAESAAARERMAQGRVGAAGDDGRDQRPEPAPAAARSRRSLREAMLAVWADLAARLRRRRSGPRSSPRALRTRLIAIAILAGVVGAGAMLSVEAATGAGSASAHPYLGVELGPALLGQSGAVVEFVAPGGPAQDAGVMVGDVITSVDGQGVASAPAVVAAVGALGPGTTATLGIDRLGAPLTITVALGSRTAASP